MINVITTVRVKPGKREDFLINVKTNLPKILAENGCIEYFAAVDVVSTIPAQVIDENIVNIIEKWASLDDLYNHLKTPHMLKHLVDVKDMLDNVRAASFES